MGGGGGRRKKKGGGSNNNNNADDAMLHNSSSDPECYTHLQQCDMNPQVGDEHADGTGSLEIRTNPDVGKERNDATGSSQSRTNPNVHDKSVDKSDSVLAGSAPSSTSLGNVRRSQQKPSPHSGTLNNASSWQKSKNWNRERSPASLVKDGMSFADVLTGTPPQTAAKTTGTSQDSNSDFPLFNRQPFAESTHSQTEMRNDQQGEGSANSEQNSYELFPSLEKQTSQPSFIDNLRKMSLDIYANRQRAEALPGFGPAEGSSEIPPSQVIPDNTSLNDKVSLNAESVEKPTTPVSEDTSSYDALNSRAFSSTVPYTLPLPEASNAVGSIPVPVLPGSSPLHSYPGTGVYHPRPQPSRLSDKFWQDKYNRDRKSI